MSRDSFQVISSYRHQYIPVSSWKKCSESSQSTLMIRMKRNGYWRKHWPAFFFKLQFFTRLRMFRDSLKALSSGYLLITLVQRDSGNGRNIWLKIEHPWERKKKTMMVRVIKSFRYCFSSNLTFNDLPDSGGWIIGVCVEECQGCLHRNFRAEQSVGKPRRRLWATPQYSCMA